MAKRRHFVENEQRILDRLREDYNRGACLSIWDDVRSGRRKQFPRGFWEKWNHRRYIAVAYVNEWREQRSLDDAVDYRYPTYEDFRKNKLDGLIKKNGHSPLQILIDAGYTNPNLDSYDAELAKTPWTVLKQLPKNYFESKKRVRYAVDWLCEKTGKKPNELVADDFVQNGLLGLLKDYHSSTYQTMRAAGYKYAPWESHSLPLNFFESPKNRIKAVRWLEKKTGQPIESMTLADFIKYSLKGLWEAMPELPRRGERNKISVGSLPEAPNTEGFFRSHPEIRREFVKTFVELYGAAPEEITLADFRGCGLDAIIWSVDGNLSRLLREAGVPLNRYNNQKLHRWTDKEAIAAIKYIVARSGRPAKDVSVSDFEKQHLTGLLNAKFGGRVFEALKFAYPSLRAEDRKKVPNNFYANKQNRISVTKKIVDGAGGISKVTARHFKKYHRLFDHVNGLTGALSEAGYVI